MKEHMDKIFRSNLVRIDVLGLEVKTIYCKIQKGNNQGDI